MTGHYLNQDKNVLFSAFFCSPGEIGMNFRPIMARCTYSIEGVAGALYIDVCKKTMEGLHKSRLKYFGLFFCGTLPFAMLVPVSRWSELSLATFITGLVMLGFAGLSLLGFPIKGNADPKDVVSGGLGLLLGTALIYLFSRF